MDTAESVVGLCAHFQQKMKGYVSSNIEFHQDWNNHQFRSSHCDSASHFKSNLCEWCLQTTTELWNIMTGSIHTMKIEKYCFCVFSLQFGVLKQNLWEKAKLPYN